MVSFYGILLLRSASHRIVVGNKVDVSHGIGVVLAKSYNFFSRGVGDGNVRQEEFEVDPLVSDGCVGDIRDVLFVEGEIPFIPQAGAVMRWRSCSRMLRSKSFPG